jgi:ADP-ribose pyrophosphatase YjhB (NUDIX family)
MHITSFTKVHHFYSCVGGFVDYGEDPVAAVTRELEEETHLRPAPNTSPQLVSVRGHPDRDTRQHIVTIAYSVQIDPTSVDGMKGDDDAVEARWMAFEDVLGGKIQMAFDHGELAKEFHQWLTLPSKSGQDRRLFLNM